MTFMSMCMGAAIGTGVVVSQYFGAKDEKGTAASIANGGYTCILIALIMTVIALVTTKPVLLLLNTPESLMPDALTYMYIFMGGLIAVAHIYAVFYFKSAWRFQNTADFSCVLQPAQHRARSAVCSCVENRCGRSSICNRFIRDNCSNLMYHLCVCQSK